MAAAFLILLSLRLMLPDEKGDVIVNLLASFIVTILFALVIFNLETSIVAADEGRKRRCYCLSLPVSKRQYVASKYVFILIFVGTVGMHLSVESQNRYHFHALYMLALLAGCAVDGIYKLNRSKVLKLREEKEAARELLRLKKERIDKMHQDEAELTRLRAEAMQSKFDMKDALERKLIKVSVSQAYQQEEHKDEG